MQDDGEQRGDHATDGDDTGHHCHCQGGRLVVLFGPVGYKEGRTGKLVSTTTGHHFPEDQAMFNAQSWALGFYQAQRNAGRHIHMLCYDANHSGAPNKPDEPWLPVAAATPAETVDLPDGTPQTMPAWNWKWQASPKINKLTDTLPKCCCFLTEVLLICHGSQGADIQFVKETLAKVIGGRPVEKFIFWSCRSGKLFMPGEAPYAELCGQFRPRMCGCGCTAGACTAFDPDGRQRHCPDGTQSTTIVTSGQFDGKPTPVGLQPSTNPPVANPFTTPDGQVRTITIAPDANPPANDQATASIGPPGNPPPSVTIINGAGTSIYPPPPIPAPPPHVPTADEQNLIARMQRASKVTGKETPYSGPVANLAQCQPSEGCLPGGGATTPP